MSDFVQLLHILNMLASLQAKEEISVSVWNTILYDFHDYFKRYGLRESYDTLTGKYGIVPFDYVPD